MSGQLIVVLVLAAALVLFILERWRYDVVALMALVSLTLLGIVPADRAFTGFGHPAVITVAAVLVVSRGIADSGLVDRLGGFLEGRTNSPTALVAGLTGLAIVCSAFINNVGALALLMPVALRLGQSNGIAPSVLLMPLAFGSLLGGMTTLIGTPPNIIISAFREEALGSSYGLFSFSPVGIGVAAVGFLFLVVAGWRILPTRQGAGNRQDVFRIDDYTTELLVPEDTDLDGEAIGGLAARTDKEFVVAAVIRDSRTIFAPSRTFEVRAGDSLVVEVAPKDLDAVLAATGLELEPRPRFTDGAVDEESLRFSEAVVTPRSRLAGQSLESIQLRATWGINVLAIARRGHRLRRRLKDVRFEPGDILLMQSETPLDSETYHQIGLLPLAERESLRRPRPRALAIALGIFAVAVACLVFRLFSAPVTFVAAALAMVVSRVVDLRTAYRAIDWPILVLLGAMIPVGEAFESTGGAAELAGLLGRMAEAVPGWVTVAVVLVLAMVLSDIMNNAATAVLLAPVAIVLARALGASPDPFLMAVAVGASCAFLTPIGHQSNTLVMGPGGYRFGDYWKVGLPLEICIVLVSVPLILWAWPL